MQIGRGRSHGWDVRGAQGRNESGRGRITARSVTNQRIDRLILGPTCESDHSVIVVGLRVRVESKIRVQLDDGISVPLDLSVHRSAGGNWDGELADTSGNVKGLR